MKKVMRWDVHDEYGWIPTHIELVEDPVHIYAYNEVHISLKPDYEPNERAKKLFHAYVDLFTNPLYTIVNSGE